MLVKVCANKNVDEAQMCIDAGVDFLGLLVGQKHSSTDFISAEKAKEIVEYAGDKINTVLVTHITNGDEIINLTKYIGNNVIQLHSNIAETEVDKILRALPDVKLIRLIHIASDGTICSNYKAMRGRDYYLLDSFNTKTNQVGGTGLTHNWQADRELIQKLDKPTFVAGGLNPDNVKTAIEQANPAGVDVNSGLRKNGVLQLDLLKKFVQNAKS